VAGRATRGMSAAVEGGVFVSGVSPEYALTTTAKSCMVTYACARNKSPRAMQNLEVNVIFPYSYPVVQFVRI
jgi:hypothetical protein